MTIEIRTLGDADREAAYRLRQQAFTASTGGEVPVPEHYAADDRRLVAMDGGEVVGHLSVWDLGQWHGGRCVPMGGVAAVAVRPTHRGRGIASALLVEALRAMRARGEVISSLFPANLGLYRGHGWEIAGSWPRRSVPALAFAALPRARPEVALRPVRPEDVPAMTAVYDARARREAGMLRRSEAFTLRMIGPDDEHYSYVAERDGAVSGYVNYRHTAPGDDDETYGITVEELVAADGVTELALWRMIGSHAPSTRTVRFVSAPSDPLAHVLGERMLRALPEHWHWMTRLVDAPGAVAARGYRGADATIELEVVDPVIPANAGPHVLEVRAGDGRLTPGGSGRVRVAVGHLASLYTGWTVPHDLARLGLLPGATEDDLDALGAAFAGPAPWVRNYF